MSIYFSDMMIKYVIFFTLNFYSIKWILYLIGNLGLSRKDVINFVLKLNSIIHTCVICKSSFLYLNGDVEKETYLLSLDVSRGYLLYDMAMIVIYSKYVSEVKLTLLHHSIFFLGLYNPIINDYTELVAKGLMSEITNPFLYLGWFLLKIKHHKTFLFILNGFVLMTLFLIKRVFNFTNLFIVSLVVKDAGIGESMTCFLLMLMNIYWFVKLMEKFFTSITNIMNS